MLDALFDSMSDSLCDKLSSLQNQLIHSASARDWQMHQRLSSTLERTEYDFRSALSELFVDLTHSDAHTCRQPDLEVAELDRRLADQERLMTALQEQVAEASSMVFAMQCLTTKITELPSLVKQALQKAEDAPEPVPEFLLSEAPALRARWSLLFHSLAQLALQA